MTWDWHTRNTPRALEALIGLQQGDVSSPLGTISQTTHTARPAMGNVSSPSHHDPRPRSIRHLGLRLCPSLAKKVKNPEPRPECRHLGQEARTTASLPEPLKIHQNSTRFFERVSPYKAPSSAVGEGFGCLSEWRFQNLKIGVGAGRKSRNSTQILIRPGHGVLLRAASFWAHECAHMQ